MISLIYDFYDSLFHSLSYPTHKIAFLHMACLNHFGWLKSWNFKTTQKLSFLTVGSNNQYLFKAKKSIKWSRKSIRFKIYFKLINSALKSNLTLNKKKVTGQDSSSELVCLWYKKIKTLRQNRNSESKDYQCQFWG